MRRRALITAVVLTVFILVGGLVFAGHSISIVIDGSEIETDVAPRLVQDRTLVPIRVITQHFGADVGWVPDTMTVEITSPYQHFMKGYGEKGMYIMQAGDVLSMVNAGTAVVMDVRSDALRKHSFIAGSMHIPMGMLLERLGELPDNKAVAVYCAKNINASYAVTILNMLGYDAYLLEDGMNAWRAAGGRITLCRV